MSKTSPIAELAARSRSFGPDAARAKLELLEAIELEGRIGARDLVPLHDTLCFLRAYPDDARVLDAVRRVGGRLREWVDALPDGGATTSLLELGLPGSSNTHYYSFGVLRHLVRMYPDCLEIDWEGLEDDIPLHNALIPLITPGEQQGLDDIELTWESWLERCKPDPDQSDLEFILGIFERADLALEVKAYLFDSCALPVTFTFERPGTGLFETVRTVDRLHYQRVEIDRRRAPRAPLTRNPLPEVKLVPTTTGRELLRLALATLCCRNLEILMLTWADPNDCWLLDCGRGVQVMLIGSLPETRDPFNTSYCHLVLKNGMPIGYGPASICLGTCEMGLNLFPAFRGGEVTFLWAQLMRCFHQVLGAQYFYLTAYGMGSGNPAAIKTGAFWFYRKLGFRAEMPEIEALALEEEEKMRERPGYRSDRSMLHRLSVTGAYLDLSGGECPRVNQGLWGNRQTWLLEERFGGDRVRGEKQCARELARRLSIDDLSRWSPDEKRALRSVAPLLSLIPGIAEWSAREKRAAVRFIKEKGSRTEARSDALLLKHPKLLEGLRELTRE